MDDTTPEMAERMREMFRQKSPTERVKMGFSMLKMSKHLITRFILENNPNILEVDLRKELFLKFYSDDYSLAEQQKILAHLEHCT